jgi:hypothetical protein
MRTSRILLTSLLSSAAIVLPALAASATPVVRAADPVAAAADPTGDVRIFSRADGLSEGQRRTIDASEFTVTPVGDDGTLRFSVTIARITRSSRFDQMVFVRLVPPAGSTDTWETQIGFSPQKPDWSYATRYLDDTGRYRNCEPLTAQRRGGTVVRLDVPSTCIPWQEAAIRVEVLTGLFRTDADPWSRDRVAVPGTFDLR